MQLNCHIFIFMIVSYESQVVGGEGLKFVELLDNYYDQPSRQSTSHKLQFSIKKIVNFDFMVTLKG